ncbi:hypothetical protein C8R46DRAFT_1061268 [Mycena filopes]|nr:hypothetical protein C8R46DRAFT_1061268 [Mycena filopes]
MSIVNEVPAVALPVEILAHIFTFLLPQPPTPRFRRFRLVDPPIAFHPSEAPLLVANICRRWRDIAISTPHLWRSCMNLHKRKDAEGVVSAWLARSLPYPVSFTLNLGRVALPQVLEETIIHCERWTAVEIIACDQVPFAFDQVRGRLPLLTKFCLDFDSAEIFECFAEAPLLKEVYIVGGIGSDPDAILLPWHQLTSLTCEGLSDLECQEILRRCPALVACSFLAERDRAGAAILSHPPIVHHQLRSLKFAEEDGNLDVIRLLELPSLRLLSVEVSSGADDDLGILRQFLARSRCQLESLSLHIITHQHILQCLPLLTSLVILKVRTYNDFLTDTLLHRFTDDPTVLPNLRKLDMDVDLQYSHRWDFTTPALRGMILSRCLGGGIGAARNAYLETFRLVYKTNEYEYEDDDDEFNLELVALADELTPLLAPKMVEFRISADSVRWA